MCQIGQPHAVRMVLGQAPRGGDAEAGFADFSRPGERQQAMAGLKFDDLLQIGLRPISSPSRIGRLLAGDAAGSGSTCAAEADLGKP